MDIYKLFRNFWDFAFENPEKIKPIHIGIFAFAVEHCNRLGWKEKFGFPSQMAMEAIGIHSYNTYIKGLNDLVEFGVIKMIQKSKNQYSSNIIALSNFNEAHNKAPDKALDKAIIKHTTKQRESTGESNDSIDIQIYQSTNLPNNQSTNLPNSNKGNLKKFQKPTHLEISNYCYERNNNVNPEKFHDFYESNGWKVGQNAMKDWKAAIRNWEKSENPPSSGRTPLTTMQHNIELSKQMGILKSQTYYEPIQIQITDEQD